MSEFVMVKRELVGRVTNPFGDPHDRFNATQELRAVLAQEAGKCEQQDNSALMKIAADLANRHPLRQLYLVCEHQGRINTDSLHEHLDKCGDLLAGIALDIRRAITSHAAPAKLVVWEGAMPESNGKSNFTVILHTGDLSEGICVYRSEYPDRARYEADCFRHIIGDPAFPEKPFICEYDADKHSGYVKPDTSPPAPVSVVLPDVAHDKAYRNGLMQGYNLALNGSEQEYQDTVSRYSKNEE